MTPEHLTLCFAETSIPNSSSTRMSCPPFQECAIDGHDVEVAMEAFVEACKVVVNRSWIEGGHPR
jgi:hypothetical protein